MFVMNCRVDTKQIVKPTPEATHPRSQKGRRNKKAQPGEPPPLPLGTNQGSTSDAEEKYNPVYCAVCDNELGLREIGPEGAYHLFHVLASTS